MIGLMLILMLLLFGIASWFAVRLTVEGSNRNAFDFIEQLFPDSSGRSISLVPVDQDQIILLQKEFKKLSPQAQELKEAKKHLIQALSYLYQELEAEAEFGRYAHSRQYERARRASQRMDEARANYVLEYKKAQNYINTYRQKMGREPISIEFPDES